MPGRWARRMTTKAREWVSRYKGGFHASDNLVCSVLGIGAWRRRMGAFPLRSLELVTGRRYSGDWHHPAPHRPRAFHLIQFEGATNPSKLPSSTGLPAAPGWEGGEIWQWRMRAGVTQLYSASAAREYAPVPRSWPDRDAPWAVATTRHSNSVTMSGTKGKVTASARPCTIRSRPKCGGSNWYQRSVEDLRRESTA